MVTSSKKQDVLSQLAAARQPLVLKKLEHGLSEEEQAQLEALEKDLEAYEELDFAPLEKLVEHYEALANRLRALLKELAGDPS